MHGDTNAENIKLVIDDAFLKKLSIVKIQNLFGFCCSAADSVNTGAYKGVLTCLWKDSKEWFHTVHCVHKIELILKDSFFKEKKFCEIHEFMIAIHTICKQSGK